MLEVDVVDVPVVPGVLVDVVLGVVVVGDVVLGLVVVDVVVGVVAAAHSPCPQASQQLAHCPTLTEPPPWGARQRSARLTMMHFVGARSW